MKIFKNPSFFPILQNFLLENKHHICTVENSTLSYWASHSGSTPFTTKIYAWTIDFINGGNEPFVIKFSTRTLKKKVEWLDDGMHFLQQKGGVVSLAAKIRNVSLTEHWSKGDFNMKVNMP